MSMRNILGHILLCFALMLCLGPMAAAFPQRNDYDLALDKYARICDRCVELRMGVESGQSVSMAELKGLLAELSSLRKTLSNASGKMSVTQTERFEAIKAKYLQSMRTFGRSRIPEPGNLPARTTMRQSFIPLPDVPRLPVAEMSGSASELAEASSGGYAVMSLRQAQRPDMQTLRPNPKAGFRNRGATTDETQSVSAGSKIAILADAGIFPTMSYGVMAVATFNDIGAYVNYRGNFRKNEYSYDCTSDGVTEYGRIWATGKTRESRSVATIGLAMFTSRRFGFRAGAGMTSYTCSWEDVSGQWAKVKDKSFKSPAADAGMFLTFSPLVLSVGCTVDFSGHADLQFGVGICF